MKIRLLCVGKPRERDAAGLHDRYAERIRRLGVPYECCSVGDVPSGGRYHDTHVREREGRALLEQLARRGGAGTVVALDPAGVGLTSDGLAERIERWATPRATFVIGGPLGLHETLLERSDYAWSLSPATFPHELVRVLVAEQLYRALTILRRIPYHK